MVSDVVLALFGNDSVVGLSAASHDDLCDFIHFICKNLSAFSLLTMSARFLNPFPRSGYLPWVVQYLVRSYIYNNS